MSLFADLEESDRVSDKKKIQETFNQRSRKILQIHSQKVIKNRKLRFTSRNWCIITEHGSKSQQRMNNFRKEKIHLFQQNDEQSNLNGKSLQALMRRQLKKDKSNMGRSTGFAMRQTDRTRISSARKILHSEQIAMLDVFPELEGKKCIINSSKQIKSKTPDLSCKKTCMSQSKYIKNLSKKINIQQQLQYQQINNWRPNTAVLSFVSKKMFQKDKISKTDEVNCDIKNSHRNKIVLSIDKTDNCLIGQIIGNSPSNLIKQRSCAQAKNTSNQLIMRAINSQNEQHERKKHLRKSLVFALKSKSQKKQLKVAIVNGMGVEKKLKVIDQQIVKKQTNLKLLESLRISGWEVNGLMECENGF